MDSNRTQNLLLSVIAVALCVIAVRPYVSPSPVQAQMVNTDPVYVEPGVTLLRIPGGGQILGKVVTNLRTGNIYGFPTNSGDPYPTSPIDSKIQTSHGFLVGHFTLGDAR